jgi:hypothetical protein
MTNQEKHQAVNPFFDIRIEDVKTVDSNRLVPRRAIINKDNDKLVAVVSDRYHIINNKALVTTFEEYLKDTDVKFIRTGAGCNRTGSQFWANYRFPGIKATFGNHPTLHVPDTTELMLDLLNGYGHTSYGFSLGGFRLICLNGARRKEIFYQVKESHASRDAAEEMVEFMTASFQTAVDLFKNELVPSWKALTQTDFNQEIAVNVMQKLDLSKMYQEKLNLIYLQQTQAKRLTSMWEFYNMITWFATHVVENRNRALATQITKIASEQIFAQAA